RERHPVEELHDEVGGSSRRIDPEVGDLDHVRMPELAEGFGLSAKPREREGIQGARLQELDGEALFQAEMEGAVDDACGALAETCVQPVLAIQDDLGS